jgi:hypothetical protein
MPRIIPLTVLAAACGSAPARPPAPAPVATPTAIAAPTVAAASSAPAKPTSAAATPTAFVCTEVIGLTITAEWYSAGFEQLVDDARFQARTRPHTFVDQWADPAHAAWTEALTSPCSEQSSTPDRVVLFAANWNLKTQDEWIRVLEAFVATAKARYAKLRQLDLLTVLRGPQNQTCGDPKSVVDPMIDAAIATVAQAHADVVHAGPKLEAPDCSVFEKGGPHFTAEGRKRIAALLAHTL